MPIDLKKRKATIANDTRSLTIDIDGEPLNIVYRRSVMTAGDARRMNELIRSARQADSSGDTLRSTELAMETLQMKQQRLIDVVVSWDLLSDSTVIPLTIPDLETYEVDHDLIDLIFAAINEDQKPNPPTAPRSVRGS